MSLALTTGALVESNSNVSDYTSFMAVVCGALAVNPMPLVWKDSIPFHPVWDGWCQQAIVVNLASGLLTIVTGSLYATENEDSG